jgi:predicted permease
MRKLRAWLLRLFGSFASRSRDHELTAELDAHLQLHIDDNLRSGMTPEEARRHALIKLGGLDAATERYRDQRGWPFLDSLLQDFRYSARVLAKNKGFTTVVILTLALGLGSVTAIFSVVNTVILNPLPAREPDRLIQIGERSAGNKGEPHFSGLDGPTVEIMRAKTNLFSEIVWYWGMGLERKTTDFIDSFGANLVSTNFFAVWDIRPILGRTFTADEATRFGNNFDLDRDTVVVLNYPLWQSRFGGDPNVLGKTITSTEGRAFTVIGVMPQHFQFPSGNRPACWIPCDGPNRKDRLANYRFFARLKTGVTIDQTRAMLDAVATELLRTNPENYNDDWHKRGGGFGFLTRPLRDEFTRTHYGAEDLQRTLWGLLAATAFVLFIVCVNIANLMLARTEKRQQEFAVRAAIGAGRSRLIRQLLSESLLLSAIGSVAGIIATLFAINVLVALIPDTIPRIRPINVDRTTLLFAMSAAIATALAFGVVPAWHGGRVSIGSVLKQSSAGASTNRNWRRYRSGLIIAEVALSLVLLTGAGLMIQSVARLLQVNPGFDTENLVFAHAGLLRNEKYYSDHKTRKAQHIEFYSQLQQRLAAIPGVQTVGICKREFFRLGYTIDGRLGTIGLLPAGTGVGSNDMFRAMRAPLLAGRHLEPTDIGPKIGTVLINQTMARLCWPEGDPINKKFRERGGRVFEVVGVVPDIKTWSYNETVEPTFYRTWHEGADTGGFGPYFAVRTTGDPAAIIPALREAIKEIEPAMTTPWFEVIRDTFYERTEAQRTYMTYLIIFASVALLLTAIGIYGVIAYSISRRTREIGVRLAVGAQRRNIANLILVGGARLIIVGVVIGALAAINLTHLMQSQLFLVTSVEPFLLIAVITLLCAVGILACYLPARRAANLNPVEALRYE